MFLAAQVSIYPLRQTHLSPAIDKALSIFRKHSLKITQGTMSSVISGDDEACHDGSGHTAYRPRAPRVILEITAADIDFPILYNIYFVNNMRKI